MATLRLTQRKVTLITIFGFLIATVFIFYPETEERKYIRQLVSDNNKPRVILLWNNLWNKKNWGFPRVTSPSSANQLPNCQVNNCLITDDRYFLKDADAVVVHAFGHLYQRPSIRLPHQRWVFLMHEPPNNVDPGYFHYFNSDFNWTQTYRLDSDVPMQYCNYVKRKTNKLDYSAIFKRKEHAVAWMVSNCDDASSRLDYARELMKHIPVHVYGKCAALLGQNNKCKRFNKECSTMLNEKYMFYLSFENCLTKDYVTEKYFDTLLLNTIPIVRGDGNYSSIGPPKSWIDTRDYRTPKDLAQYLKHLMKNEEKYIEYLKWKEDYEVVTGRLEYPIDESGFCLLCKKLNDPSEPRKMYKDITAWHGTCRKADDY